MTSNNNIPKHWELKSIKEAFEIAKEKGVENSVPYLEIGDIDINTKSYILKSKPAVKGCKISKNGDLLISRVRPTRGAIVQIKENIIPVSSAFTILRNKKLFFDSFPFYFFAWNNEFHNYLGKNCSGSLYPTVSESILTDYQILIPPYKEQELIVSKIEELLSDLENGKQQLQKAQQQLKVYRQSLLKWAFEGKLTNKKVKEGELPKGWKRVKVSEIANVVRGGSPRPAGDPKFYDGKIPFLKVRDITKDSGTYLTTFEYTIKEAGLHKTRQIKPNTLLLSNSGATLGVPKICMIDATMNDGIAAFLELDQRSNLFLYYFWVSKTRELRNINMGAAQPNLNTDIIKNYLVPYCSFEEQQLIVDELESKLTVCDKIEETISQSLQQAETLKQSILKKAFEGKLVSTEVKTSKKNELV